MKKTYNLIALLCVVTIATNCGNGKKELEAIENKELQERHCNVIWDSLDFKEKTVLLDEFRSNTKAILGKNVSFRLNQSYDELIKGSVKYPSTIRDEDGDKPLFYLSQYNSQILDPDEGTILFYERFTAENKLSIKVKMESQFVMKYNAQCKRPQIIDFKIN